MLDLNERIFLLINATDHPAAVVVAAANFIAADVIFGVLLVLAGLWIWGDGGRRAGLLATALATAVALGLNQIFGLLWYEPRPFMVGLGHTLAAHAPENSFPSDHATFMFTIGLGLIFTEASRSWGLMVCAAGLAVAWARVYLGLHFPIDMLSSAILAGICAAGAKRVERPLGAHVVPFANRLYDRVLDALRFPRSTFPRTPEAK